MEFWKGGSLGSGSGSTSKIVSSGRRFPDLTVSCICREREDAEVGLRACGSETCSCEGGGGGGGGGDRDRDREIDRDRESHTERDGHKQRQRDREIERQRPRQRQRQREGVLLLIETQAASKLLWTRRSGSHADIRPTGERLRVRGPGHT